MTRALFIAGLCALGATLQWQGYKLAAGAARTNEAVAHLQAQNERQLAENKELARQIAWVRDAPDAAYEELAREKLFMIMPDEIYVLPESETR